MARLVPFSLAIGTIVDIRGERFRCADPNFGKASVLLAPLADGTPLEISRNELAALLVTEEARLCDELEEPEPQVLREVTDTSGLSMVRLLDWQLKMFLCRVLMPVKGHSPKSKAYRAVFDEASAFVGELYAPLELKFQWSVWTVYHDLLRWQASGYDLAALQRKGVEYTPWRDDAKARSHKALALIEAILAENPNLSASGLHKEVEKRWHDDAERPGA